MMVRRLWPLLLFGLAFTAIGEEDSDEGIRVLLAPALESTLSSQVAGRITQLNASLGSSFAKGDTLVALDCAEQQARLQMSQAELAAAKETHSAKLRLKDLQQAGEVEVALAASEAERARAQVALYQAQVGQCSIRAPFAGRVVKLAVKPFEGVSPGQPLLEIVSSEVPKLRLNVPANWSTWLESGSPFEVQIDETGQRYPAKVSAINGRVDAVSQTLELEARLEAGHAELLPGMSGSAHFPPAP
jgi:membrane fusion protein, multidrug efflux system